MYDAWSSCIILSNKNAQIEKVTNITSEKHTLLDLFVAMGFDDRAFFVMESKKIFVILSYLTFNIPTIYTHLTHCLKTTK